MIILKINSQFTEIPFSTEISDPMQLQSKNLLQNSKTLQKTQHQSDLKFKLLKIFKHFLPKYLSTLNSFHAHSTKHSHEIKASNTSKKKIYQSCAVLIIIIQQKLTISGISNQNLMNSLRS